MFELRARFLCAPPVNNRDTATKDFSGSLSLSIRKVLWRAGKEDGRTPRNELIALSVRSRV